MTPTEKVIEIWNSKKQRGNAWKSHRELTYETRQAIQSTLRKYRLGQITEAIDNYAKVLLGKEYKWSYAWSLYQFLTRHKPDQRQELQLYRWLPSNFYEEDYYSELYKKHLRSKYRQKREEEEAEIRQEVESLSPEEYYRTLSTEKLIKARNSRFGKRDHPIIDRIIAERELSPEIFTEV